jgi:hypothetical protein
MVIIPERLRWMSLTLSLLILVLGTTSLPSSGYANEIPYTFSGTSCDIIGGDSDTDQSGNINGSTSSHSAVGGVGGSAEADASTDYGLNRAWAEAEYIEFPDTFGVNSVANSYWWDQWTIEDPNESPGSESSMTVYITLTGELTGGAHMGYSFYQDLRGVIEEELEVNQTNFENGKTYAIPLNFFYGEPFDVGAYLTASALSLESLNLVEADFFSTAELDGVFLPSGATLTAASGTEYAVVPLPSAIILLGTGLAGLGAIGWRIKRG